LRSKQGVDLVVVLSHLGLPQDIKLLSEVSGVDVLLSGHTHHRLYSPVWQRNTLVIQSGCHGSFLGRLDLEVERGRVVGHRHELLEVTESVQPDPSVDTLVQAALKPHAAEFEPVGEVGTALNRNTATMDNFLLEVPISPCRPSQSDTAGNRKDLAQDVHEAMLAFLEKHKPATKRTLCAGLAACPLLRVKRTSLVLPRMSANDP
jgi:hypothetical protein